MYEYVMSQPNVVSRVNSMVQSMERPYVDLTGGQLSTGRQKKNNNNNNNSSNNNATTKNGKTE